jgi:hypothetical protein
MKKILNEGNQIHNFMSSSVSGTVINYGSGSDLITSYGSGCTTLPAGGSARPPFPQRHGAHVLGARRGRCHKICSVFRIRKYFLRTGGSVILNYGYGSMRGQLITPFRFGHFCGHGKQIIK